MVCHSGRGRTRSIRSASLGIVEAVAYDDTRSCRNPDRSQTHGPARGSEVGRLHWRRAGPRHRDETRRRGPIGLPGLARIVAASPVSVVVIGGPGAADFPYLRAAGAAGLTVVSGVTRAVAPAAAARTLRRRFDAAGGARVVTIGTSLLQNPVVRYHDYTRCQGRAHGLHTNGHARSRPASRLAQSGGRVQAEGPAVERGDDAVIAPDPRLLCVAGITVSLTPVLADVTPPVCQRPIRSDAAGNCP